MCSVAVEVGEAETIETRRLCIAIAIFTGDAMVSFGWVFFQKY